VPIPAVAGFGKAAQPLGVATDRFDGLAQGKKRAQAGSGKAAEVLVYVETISSEGPETTSTEFLARCAAT